VDATLFSACLERILAQVEVGFSNSPAVLLSTFTYRPSLLNGKAHFEAIVKKTATILLLLLASSSCRREAAYDHYARAWPSR
jgi:hypothetical protein